MKVKEALIAMMENMYEANLKPVGRKKKINCDTWQINLTNKV